MSSTLEKLSDIKILLVDDREDNLFSMRTILEKDGYTIRSATSGHQALKILLQEVDFTLIIMDVHMPILDGIETAEMIYKRDKLKHIPIIFITANNTNDHNAFQGYMAGAVDYIYKPINPDLLRAKVSVFADLYRTNHQLIQQEKNLLDTNSELEERVKQRTEELSLKNQELEKKNEELQRVNVDLDNFIYAASHDLNAPVMNIEGLLICLFRDFNINNSEFKEVKKLLTMSVNKLKNTIKDLTEISKIQKEDFDDVEVVKFEELFEEVIFNINDSIEKKNVKLVTRFNAPEINFSRKNIRSIFYNLVSNAVKYSSPDRSPVVSITTQITNNMLQLTVSDNGLGINPAFQPKIFDMFKRFHTHVEGSGVGLYIVKRIIDNHGGRIEVKSQPDEGTTFNVYFRPESVLKQLTGTGYEEKN